jgi:hypothetical protein
MNEKDSTEQKTPEKKGRKNENRTRQVHLMVTDDEFAILKSLSKDFKNVSDYVRHCALSDKNRKFRLTSEVLENIKKLTKEVNAVGNNINHVARYVNFLEENNIKHTPAIERFNLEILQYTAMQITIEKTIAKFLKL